MKQIGIFVALIFSALLSLQGGDISAREARRLASGYSLCVVGMGCGGVGAPTLHGNSWEVPVFLDLPPHRKQNDASLSNQAMERTPPP